MFKYIKFVLFIVIIVLVVLVVFAFYSLGNITIRQTKDYAVMSVESNDVINWEIMILPPEKYSQLLQIPLVTREEVAEYMKKNNYKLKCQKQKFVRNNPTYEELIDGFEFEKIN